MEDNQILIAKKVMHKRALQGIISSGGKFQVGNIIVEVVAQSGDFRHVQIYQQGLNAKPVKQSWVKSKKVIEKKIVEKEKVVYKEKPKKEQKKLTTTVTDEVITL